MAKAFGSRLKHGCRCVCGTNRKALDEDMNEYERRLMSIWHGAGKWAHREDCEPLSLGIMHSLVLVVKVGFFAYTKVERQRLPKASCGPSMYAASTVLVGL
jgi:hypothetical protein